VPSLLAGREPALLGWGVTAWDACFPYLGITVGNRPTVAHAQRIAAESSACLPFDAMAATLRHRIAVRATTPSDQDMDMKTDRCTRTDRGRKTDRRTRDDGLGLERGPRAAGHLRPQARHAHGQCHAVRGGDHDLVAGFRAPPARDPKSSAVEPVAYVGPSFGVQCAVAVITNRSFATSAASSEKETGHR
jgi:hypothetical protein